MLNHNSVIRSLLIPLCQRQLLLPSTIVAEVSAYTQPEKTVETQLAWLLGMVHWRHHHIPVVSLENLWSLPHTAVSTKRQRIIILYGLEFTDTLPFYAFTAADIPRTLAISENSLTQPSTEVPQGVVLSVQLSEQETVWFPDLVYLENLLHQQFSTES